MRNEFWILLSVDKVFFSLTVGVSDFIKSSDLCPVVDLFPEQKIMKKY